MRLLQWVPASYTYQHLCSYTPSLSRQSRITSFMEMIYFSMPLQRISLSLDERLLECDLKRGNLSQGAICLLRLQKKVPM